MLLKRNRKQQFVLPLNRLYFRDQLLSAVFKDHDIPKRSNDFNMLFKCLTGIETRQKILYFDGINDVFRFFSQYTMVIDAACADNRVCVPEQFRERILSIYYASRSFGDDDILKKHSMFKIWVSGSRIIGFISQQHFLKYVLATSGE